MQNRLLILIAAFILISFSVQSQILSIDEIISAPTKESDYIDELLLSKKWEKYNYEVHSDSGFVKHIWVIKNNYNDLKSYFTYQQYDASAIENHITYQFSDRNLYKSFLIDLKKKDYKVLTLKKKKSKKKKDKSKGKVEEFYFLSEKNNSLVVVKDVFMLGFNVFLTSAYNSNSQIGKRILEARDDD